jgi:Flp pilus assembly protein TadB
LGVPVLVAGAGLCAVSGKAFSSIVLSKKKYLRKRDKQFKKVADKINQALAAGGPLVQSSNQ